MQKVRGSNPLSSTPGQRPVPISGTGLLHASTAAKYSSSREPSRPVRGVVGLQLVALVVDVGGLVVVEQVA